MLIKRRFALLIAAVLLLNALIYLRAYLTIESADLVFAECARNSGRTSAALNLLLLLMLGYFGLKKIFNDYKKRHMFLVLMSLFAINHLIHFFFVYQNFKSQLVEMDITKNIHGFITFTLIVLLPFILWKIKNLTNLWYFITFIHFMNVTYFMIDTFYSRVKPEDPAYLHLAGIALMLVAVLYAVYRLIRERKVDFVSN